ncbi:MAG: acyl carrier protein [Myxococcota bacterium]
MNNNSIQVSEEQLLTLFRQALWDIDRKKVDKLELDTRFSQLGLDSIVIFEVVSYLEERLGVLLPDDRLQTLVCLRELHELLNSLPPPKK